jgi:YHS domain-containing protein
MRHAIKTTLAGSLLATLGLLAVAADDKASARRGDQETLKAYGELVGSWRGIGQVKARQSAGAWKESASWAWKLADDSAALAIDVETGKYLKSALLKPGRGKGAGTFVLEATLADGSKRTFSGKPPKEPDRPLVLVAEGGGEGVRRVTLSIPNENRFLLLFESEPSTKSFARLGEVGFTRNGVAFAAGESGPTCIVTEGRGTIQVSHKGKSYYVCCSGCKDLFNKDPESILAEAAERAKAKEKK